MAHVELQNLIEDLATRLNSPTVLEDEDQHMIVYSAHREPIDDIRRDSILLREARPATKAWLRRYNILQAERPLRIPRDPEAGVLGRLCVPVRHLNRLMGFIWLIDDEVRLSDREVSAAVDVASYVGLTLYHDELTRRLADDTLAQLFSPTAERREAAARDLAESAALDVDRPCAVVVVQPLDLAEHELRGRVTETLWEIARRGNRTAKHLHLVNGDHGVLLVPLRSVEDDGRARLIAREVREVAGRHGRVVAAIGEPQQRSTDAVISYQQAKLAAKVARLVPAVGDLPRWRDLGAFRVLAQLPSEQAAAAGLDPRLATVLRSGDDAVVLTLETYLELGCDAKATAERLHLHRGTLYYRLQKAERIGGLDLHNGDDRLSVHLGFKLARYTGLLRTPPL